MICATTRAPSSTSTRPIRSGAASPGLRSQVPRAQNRPHHRALQPRALRRACGDGPGRRDAGPHPRNAAVRYDARRTHRLEPSADRRRRRAHLLERARIGLGGRRDGQARRGGRQSPRDYLRLLRSIGPGLYGSPTRCRSTSCGSASCVYSSRTRGSFTAGGIRSTLACRSTRRSSRRAGICERSRRSRLLLSPVPPADEHWRAVLPSDRLLDVDYEDATAAPEETARRLIAFCGLEWTLRASSPSATGRREDGQHVAGASTDLPHLGGTLAELRTVDRRASSLASGSVVSGDFPSQRRES